MILKGKIGVRLGAAAGAVLLSGLVPGAVAAGSKPIVDIRFNADYSQIASSVGDEWAPTWADDGNLYTGNDDGSSFGGIKSSSVAFGKLSGDDPFKLQKTTISDISGYGKNEIGSDHAN